MFMREAMASCPYTTDITWLLPALSPTWERGSGRTFSPMTHVIMSLCTKTPILAGDVITA